MEPALEGCNVIEACDYFLSASFSPFDKYTATECPVSFYLFFFGFYGV
jgi:hypothetical protein